MSAFDIAQQPAPVAGRVVHRLAQGRLPGNLLLRFVQPGLELVERRLAALLARRQRSLLTASFRSRSMPYSLLIRFSAMPAGQSCPWVAPSVRRRTCAAHAPSSPGVRCRLVRPRRCSRRSRRSSGSRDSRRAGATAPPMRGWWCNRRGSPVYLAAHRFAPTSKTVRWGHVQVRAIPAGASRRRATASTPAACRASG